MIIWTQILDILLAVYQMLQIRKIFDVVQIDVLDFAVAVDFGDLLSIFHLFLRQIHELAIFRD